MFTLNSFADVLLIARTFGVAALDFALANGTLNTHQRSLVADCRRWSTRQVVTITEVNDGNTEYTIDAVFSSTELAGQYFTNMDDITINRQGFGFFVLGAGQALVLKEITTEQLAMVLKEIAERNEARAILGL